MASSWPVWCEIVCCKCSDTTSGQFNTVKFNKGKMRVMAIHRGWRIIADDWICKKCLEGSKMPFIIQANTPEEMRIAIVKWLNHNASVSRIRAGNIVGKRMAARQLAIASTYEDAAKFIEAIVIERHA